MTSDLDFSQCIQRAYDDSTQRLRVDAELTSTIIPSPGLEVSIVAASDNIAIRNSSNNHELLINSDGSINVVSSGGGGGDASAANQVIGNNSLASIDNKLTSQATSTNQTTQTTVLNNIDNNQLINTSCIYASISVTSTPVHAKVGGSPLSGRKVLIITPTNGVIYWGANNSVATTTGMPILSLQSVSFSFTDAVPIWLVSSGTIDVRVVEAK